MFGFLAILTFTVAMFGGHFGSINMLYLGLAFMAAQLMLDGALLPEWVYRRRQP